MIALENCIERKKIISISYNGLEIYVPVCNWNMCFYVGSETDVNNPVIGWHKMSTQ